MYVISSALSVLIYSGTYKAVVTLVRVHVNLP